MLLSHTLYVVIIASLVAVVDSCIKGCECTHTQLHCTCANGTSQLHLLPYHLKTRPTQVHVTGCHTVNVYPWNSVFESPLHVFNVSNVENLHINQLAFQRVTDMHQLIISNTRIINWTSDSFEGIQRVHRIHFYNVTSEQIPTNSFRDLNQVGDLSFVNCHFKSVEINAFNNTNNVTRFAFLNSTVGVFESESISISGCDEFVLSHLDVDKFETRSLAPSDVNKVIIRNCKVSELMPEFIAASNANSVLIRHNAVGMVHSNAFSGLRNVSEFEISRNMFSHTPKDSFTFDSMEIRNKLFEGNRFSCTCDIYWMLDAAQNDDIYQGIVNNNTCFAPDPMKGKKVSEMNSYSDDVDICEDENVESSGYVSIKMSSEIPLSEVVPQLRENNDTSETSKNYFSYSMILTTLVFLQILSSD